MRYLFLAIIISGCAHKITQSTNTIEKDSLSIKIVHHYDTVRIKGDSVWFVDSSPVYKTDTVIITKQGRAELDITRKRGVTTTKCKCDSIQKALSFAIQDTSHYKTKTITITKTVIETHISGFDWFCRGIFFLLVLIIVGLILHKTGIFKIPFL